MTLIAAFRCSGGVVICADSQETVGSVRVATNKVTPQEFGEYHVAIAGTGNGDLIDGFVDALAREIETWPKGLAENTARGLTRGLLLDFHMNEVEQYPANSPEDKLSHFLVCIKPKQSSDIFLWELRGSAIVTVGDYTLLGIGEAIYKHELKRLYRGQPSALQSILIGIHLFSLAKETSNYIGGQTDIIFVHDKGMTQQSAEAILELEQRITYFNSRLAELLLVFPDPSVTVQQVRGQLEEFKEEMVGIFNYLTMHQVFPEIRKKTDPDNTHPLAYIPSHIMTSFMGHIYDARNRPPKQLPVAKKKRSQPSKSKKSKGQQ